MTNKEFDRGVCFMFFECYLEQAQEIRQAYGDTAAYQCLEGICRYALYQEEPEDQLAKIVVTGLKNTIDAGQKKRANGFSKENKEQTNAVLKYIKENPGATQKEIANVVGCSVGKVNKVLKSVDTPTSTLTLNTNSTSNINSLNVNVNTQSAPQEPIREKDYDDLTSIERCDIFRDYLEHGNIDKLVQDYETSKEVVQRIIDEYGDDWPFA